MAENLDLILGGFQSAGKALDPYVQRQQGQLDRAQPLSPYEKHLALVLSGKLSPEQAAAHAQLGLPLPGEEAQPAQGAAPSPQPMPQVGQQAMMPPGGTQNPSYPPMGNPDISVGPQMGDGRVPPQQSPLSYQPRPVPAAQAPAPQTRGDMASLMGAAGFLRSASGVSPADRFAIEQMKEQGRETRSVRGDATRNKSINQRGSVEAAKLTESARQADAKIQLGYDSLETRWKIADRMLSEAMGRLRTKGGMDKEVEALRQRGALLRSQTNAFVTELTSLGKLADDPDIQEQIDKGKQTIHDATDALMNDILLLQDKGTTRGQRETSLPGETTPEGIKEPAQGSIAPPARPVPDSVVRQKLVQTGGGTTSAGAQKIPVKNTETGAVGRVSPDNPGLKDGTYVRL